MPFEEVGFQKGLTYFEYPYDWRQSNFTTASDMAVWIAAHPILSRTEFDLVGHSMGGLIAEIYVRRHDPERRVRRLVTMGTPLAGAVRAAGVLDDGWGDLANWFAGGLPRIKSVVLSFPSVYELLPRHPNCCAVGVPGDAIVFDVTTDEGWELIDWRAETPPNPLQTKLALAAARELGALVASPLPEHLEVFRIVSTLFATPHTFYVHPGDGAVHAIRQGPGDGVVATFSATQAREDVVDVTNAKHPIIFDDDGFVGALEVIFNDVIEPPSEVADPAVSVLTTDGRVIVLETLGVRPLKSIAAVGSPIDVEVLITADGEVPLDDLEVSLTHPNGGRIHASLIAGTYRFDAFEGARGRSQALFLGTLQGMATEGTLRFIVQVGRVTVAKDAVQVVDFDGK